MTDTYTAADDLAALDRVAALARAAGLGERSIFNGLDHLRVPIVRALERRQRLAGIGPGVPVDDIVANAAKVALDRFEEGGLLHLSRVNVLHAAAMLLEAAGRMGGDR